VLLLLDMNAQADSLIESGQFDAASIQEKRQSINERYERIKNLAAHRQARLNEANTLHQFFRDIADEESWIKYEYYIMKPTLDFLGSTLWCKIKCLV